MTRDLWFVTREKRRSRDRVFQSLVTQGNHRIDAHPYVGGGVARPIAHHHGISDATQESASAKDRRWSRPGSSDVTFLVAS